MLQKPFLDLLKRALRVSRTYSDDPQRSNAASEAELLLAAYLRAYRARLKRGAFQGSFALKAKIARRRFARDKAQQLARRIRQGKRVPLKREALLKRFIDSPILTALLPDRLERWIPITKRRNREFVVELTLRDFSIIDNPGDTLKAIKKIAEIECEAVSGQLHFDDTHCADIGAYLVLAEIWPAIPNLFRGGRMSKPVQKVIEAVGLREPLRMKFPEANELDDVWAFPLHRRRPAGASRSPTRDLEPQRREKVADRFCAAVNEWLALPEIEMELSEHGLSWFSSIIGELLDNAERHSKLLGNDGSWSVAAFMARRIENGQVVYRCHMAFLSEGTSIAESLENCAPEISEELDAYCGRHYRAGQSRDTLATLFAIQDGVTRDTLASAEGRGGVGFQDVLRFVDDLGGTSAVGYEPKLTIVSGRSCLRLRPPYMIGQRRGTHAPRVLWCNEHNDAASPPDPAYVFDLEERFGGTIVGLAFVLDPEYLRTKIDE